MKVFTDAGWITGSMHVPSKSRILDHLNHSREFIALTDVRFSTKPDPIPFFAVQRDLMTLMIVPPNEQLYTVGIEEMTVHKLSCMLPNGTLYGRFKTLRGVRVSDYISAARGFFVLDECNLWLTDRFGRAVTEEHHAHVLVNIRYLIGVTEDESNPSSP